LEAPDKDIPRINGRFPVVKRDGVFGNFWLSYGKIMEYMDKSKPLDIERTDWKL